MSRTQSYEGSLGIMAVICFFILLRGLRSIYHATVQNNLTLPGETVSILRQFPVEEPQIGIAGLLAEGVHIPLTPVVVANAGLVA